MKLLKSTLLIATIVLSGPAMANGGLSFPFLPSLEFPPEKAAATKGLTTVIEVPAHSCSQPASGRTKAQAEACAASAQTGLITHKRISDK